MSRKFWIAIIVFSLFFVGVALTSAVGFRSLSPGRIGYGTSSGRDRVALIYIEGTIVGESSSGGGFLSGITASSVEIVNLLEQARKDPRVKGILLRIDSPGGSAAASQEIYNEIKRVRKEKPVVVSMGDMAASGGYYVASSADYIFANPATITGSIGVIFSLIEMSDLMRKLGITDQTLKAGQFKDIGSTFRKMTEQEKNLLQEMLNQVHAQFIKAVAEGREMEEEKVRKLATGIVMTGEQALREGLIDELGGLEKAKAKARELANLPEDAPVVPYKRKPSIFDIFGLFGGESLAKLLANSDLAYGSSVSNTRTNLLSRLAKNLFMSDLSIQFK